MKNLVIAFCFAVALHGLVLCADPSWLREKPHFPARAQAVTITLFHPPSEAVPEVTTRPRPQESKTPAPRKPVRAPVPASSEKVLPAKPMGGPPPNEFSSPFDALPDKKLPDILPPPPQPDLASLPSASSSSSDPLTAVLEARPLYRNNPPPVYPALARRLGYEGSILLEVFVDRSGSVREARIIESSGHGVLDRAAVAAVKRWAFEPARRGNDPMDSWVRVPIRFELK